LLYELLPRFRRRWLVLDRRETGTDVQAKALALAATLRSLGIRRVNLPSGYKDPGELDERGLFKLVEATKMR